MKKILILFLFPICSLANPGLPPTSSKISGDSNNVTTFNYQFPNLTGTHTGITVSIPTFPLPSPSPSGDYLQANGTAWIATAVTPGSITAPTIQQFTSGSGTYTTPMSPSPLYIRVVMVGGGGGGGGGGSVTGYGGNGTGGGNTTFGTTLLVANGGTAGMGGVGGAGGTGGTASLGSGPKGIAVQGGYGTSGENSVIGTITNQAGIGCSSPFGGVGAPVAGSGGNNATAYGSGGAGGGLSNGTATGSWSGGGGSCGGYVDAIITSPSSTYSYVVGSAGSGGSAGTNGFTGGNGFSGIITVYEYYQ